MRGTMTGGAARRRLAPVGISCFLLGCTGDIRLDDGGGPAEGSTEVLGTLILPEDSSDEDWFVALVVRMDFGDDSTYVPIYQIFGVSGGGRALAYRFDSVRAGAYFSLAVVDRDASDA